MYVVMCEATSKAHAQSGITNHIDDLKHARANRAGHILWKSYCADVPNCHWNTAGECPIHCPKKFSCFFFEVLPSFSVHLILEILKYIDYFTFTTKSIKSKLVEGFTVSISNLLQNWTKLLHNVFWRIPQTFDLFVEVPFLMSPFG